MQHEVVYDLIYEFLSFISKSLKKGLKSKSQITAEKGFKSKS